jgi:hypothetical protein
MKIFITNILPSSLKNKLTKMQGFEVKSFNKTEIASEDYGLHIIENNKIYRVEPTFEKNLQLIKNFGNTRVELLLDKNKYIHCHVVSQMPVNYILTKLLILEYQTSKKSKLKLVVECLKETITIGSYFSPDKHIGEDIVPINFYFVFDEPTNNLDIMDQFFQEEINVFLSHLN